MGRKNRTGLWVEYFLAWTGKKIFSVLPWCWAQKAGYFLGLLVQYFVPSRRKLVIDNLRYAFPKKKDEEKRQIARKVWENIGMTAGEFIKIKQLNSDNLSRYVKIYGEEYLKEVLASNKGGILFSAHFCNWEIVQIALSLKGYPIAAIARPLKNSLVDRMVNNIRESSGTKIIFAKNSIGQALNWLKTNGLLYVLLDQRITAGNVYVDFFGRPAATSSIAILLARRTGAKIIPIYSIRREDGGIEIHIQKPVNLIEKDKIREEILLNTLLFSKIIESWIREYPHYWFWVHNRWKRKGNV